MTKHRIAAVLFSALLLLILGGPAVMAAPQAAENPLCIAQSAGQETGNGQREAAEVVTENPTPLAQPINGKNGPSPLILCGAAAIVVAVVIVALILWKARKFE